ncbi:MAG: guanylate kinase, partial [Verrucomicrobiales bacterium]
MTTRSGLLLLVSGPSGSGKTTLCRQLADEGEVHYATSCTTRPMREGEKNGHDYHFLSLAEFEQRIAQGHFLEHARVHENHYGTLKSEVLDHLRAGRDVVMDIDIQGADLVRACPDPHIQKALIDLFVMPASEAELRQRLTGRGTDPDEVIELRMKNALAEIAAWPKYSYRLLSTTREADRSEEHT